MVTMVMLHSSIPRYVAKIQLSKIPVALSFVAPKSHT